MADTISKEARSRLMAKVKGQDTGLEIGMLKLLRSKGLRPKRNVKGLPGRPDFVLTNPKLAIFVDGDFWHGWQFPRWSKKLQPYWREKISKNRKRDRRNFARLRAHGWAVIRIWEHDLDMDPEGCLRLIISTISGRRRIQNLANTQKPQKAPRE